jgi:hypothetical protein
MRMFVAFLQLPPFSIKRTYALRAAGHTKLMGLFFTTESAAHTEKKLHYYMVTFSWPFPGLPRPASQSLD